MSGKILGLTLAAAMVVMAPQAEARRLFWWEAQPRQQDYVDPNDRSYDPYADQQDSDVQDMFNQEQYDLYVREMQRRHQLDYGRDRYDRTYYDQNAQDPAYTQDDTLQPHLAKPVKPKKPKILKAATPKPAVETPAQVTASAAKPTTDTTNAATANSAASLSPVATANAAETKKVVETPKTVKGGKVTCAKGEEIVASFGFLDISQKTCEGTSLVYSAVRGSSNFEVEVNPVNGEVTAVRKLS